MICILSGLSSCNNAACCGLSIVQTRQTIRGSTISCGSYCIWRHRILSSLGSKKQNTAFLLSRSCYVCQRMACKPPSRSNTEQYLPNAYDRQCLCACLSRFFLRYVPFPPLPYSPSHKKKYSVKCSYRAFFTVYKYGANEHFNNLTDILCHVMRFNTLKILAKANGTDSNYALTLLQNGQTLYQTKLDHTAIASNYITLSIPVQKPKKNTRYELKISASDASKGDGILFGYRLSKTLGTIQAHCTLTPEMFPMICFCRFTKSSKYLICRSAAI